jgi:Tfp pilus assembly protein PilO
VNELLAQLRALVEKRSPRERWLAVLAACVALALALQAFVAGPLRDRLARTHSEIERLESDLQISARMSREIRRLRSDLSLVEARIKPGETTNLFTLLESLAGEAQIRDQLESIKPKQPSGNDRYPETRVEVSLKGATLKQTVQFLHKIESAPMLLIIRSLRIKSREDQSQLLDVSFSVSSFKQA